MLSPLSGWISEACWPALSMAELYEKGGGQGKGALGEFSRIAVEIHLDMASCGKPKTLKCFESKPFGSRVGMTLFLTKFA